MFTFSREMGFLPLPAYFCAVESIHSEISVTSDLNPHSRILRLEIMHMNYDMKQSGERIQQLRIQHGYTQEEFAKALNIDRSNLSRIESGRRGCSMDLLIQLSNIFGVTLDYIIFGQDRPDWVTTDNRERLKFSLEQLINQLETFKSSL